VRGDVDEEGVFLDAVEATLQDAEEFEFVEVFVLSFAGFDLVDQFDFGVFVDCEYFEEVGADSVVFLRPEFDHLQYVFVLGFLLALGELFECEFVLVFL
jgi:hypothetical protein